MCLKQTTMRFRVCQTPQELGQLTFLNSDAHLRMVVEIGGGSVARGARTESINK